MRLFLFKIYLQNIPRSVVLDTKTQRNLIQWPVEEVETLRSKKHNEFKDVELQAGSLIPLDIGSATQVLYQPFSFYLSPVDWPP